MSGAFLCHQGAWIGGGRPAPGRGWIGLSRRGRLVCLGAPAAPGRRARASAAGVRPASGGDSAGAAASDRGEEDPGARRAGDPQLVARLAGRSFILVLGVDDNEQVGRSLALRLAQEPDLLWVGLLRSADALVDEAGRLRPNIVLLDIDMPGKDPFKALEELAATRPETRVVMFSGHVRRDLIDRAFEAGAWGYLSKHDEMSAIAAALRRVMAGEIVMSADVASLMHG